MFFCNFKCARSFITSSWPFTLASCGGSFLPLWHAFGGSRTGIEILCSDRHVMVSWFRFHMVSPSIGSHPVGIGDWFCSHTRIQTYLRSWFRSSVFVLVCGALGGWTMKSQQWETKSSHPSVDHIFVSVPVFAHESLEKWKRNRCTRLRLTVLPDYPWRFISRGPPKIEFCSRDELIIEEMQTCASGTTIEVIEIYNFQVKKQSEFKLVCLSKSDPIEVCFCPALSFYQSLFDLCPGVCVCVYVLGAVKAWTKEEIHDILCWKEELS